MPQKERGGDANSADEKDERVWGQRCSLYIYRSKAKNWVKVGTGKGTIVRSKAASGKAEFRFEDNMQIPMAQHYVESISELQQNSGTAKGCSWTTDADVIHLKGQQWFTAKFASSAAAESFKDALLVLMQDSQASIAPPLAGELSPLLNARAEFQEAQPDTSFAQDRQLAVQQYQQQHQGSAQDSLESVLVPFRSGRVSRRKGSRSPSPLPADSLSPTFGGGRMLSEPWSPSWATGRPLVAPLEAWLVYFERSIVRNAMRETSTIYVGAYDTKERSLVMCIRAMDQHCDKKEPWRDRRFWEQVEDRRSYIGDKGVAISVRNATGSFNRVWICRMGFNQELPESGHSETLLWGDEE